MQQEFSQIFYTTQDGLSMQMRAFRDVDGEVWFVAKDVCEILGLTNPTMALENLDDDERSKFNLGRQGQVNCVNEPGLYMLIFKSRKPEAKNFRRWVTWEVLPALRKYGRYETWEERFNRQREMTADELVADYAKEDTERALVPVVYKMRDTRKMRPILQGHFKAAKTIIYAACSGDVVEALALDEIFKSYTGFSALSTGKIIDEVERVKWLDDIRESNVLRDWHERKHPDYYEIL